MEQQLSFEEKSKFDFVKELKKKSNLLLLELGML
jgi:hypothetical protein